MARPTASTDSRGFSLRLVLVPPRLACPHSGERAQSVTFYVMAAGCGGMIHQGSPDPTHCAVEPIVAGLWFATFGRTALIIAIRSHRDLTAVSQQGKGVGGAVPLDTGHHP